MESEAVFLLQLGLILLFANLGGMIAVKLKQSSVLGQIIAGLIIGPAVFNVIAPTEFIDNIAEIGVVLLMFIAGMETDLNELKKSAVSSISISLVGIIVPFLGGYLVSKLLFPLGGDVQAIFLGAILSATSISITVHALRELGKIRTKIGINILGAAITDDILGIILLTFILAIIIPISESNIVMVIIKIVLFFILAISLGRIFVIIMNKYARKLLENRNVAALALIACLLLAFVAEEFGVAAIIGAYFTGVIFSLTPNSHRVSYDLQNISYTVFIPIFFMNIGLHTNFTGISGMIIPVIIICLVAIFGKSIGCFLGAKIAKFKNKEALQIAIGMIPRVEVALIVANLAKKIGVINQTIFTSSIIMVIVTTLITPPLLKIAFKKDQLD